MGKPLFGAAFSVVFLRLGAGNLLSALSFPA